MNPSDCDGAFFAGYWFGLFMGIGGTVIMWATGAVVLR